MQEIQRSTLIEKLSKLIFENDGVTIEDFFLETLGIESNYLQDSIWLVDGKQLDDRDMKCKIEEKLKDVGNEELESICLEWTDNDIDYQGDGIFLVGERE
jgi:hypothetical protein